MKTIIINASPRKKWNTAEVLDAARKGAESVGSEVEYVNLYDLVFKGCRSCLICKRKDKTKGKCYWKDDLTPPLEFYEQSMKDSLSSTEFLFSFLNGEVISYPVCDTLQVHKYSEYNMAGFSQEAKEKQLILQFPNDLEKAFEIAANLSKG